MITASPQDIAHLEHAIALALTARDRGDHPFGSVVVAPDGTVVEGSNSVVTQSDPTGHAETNVVRAAAAALDRGRARGIRPLHEHRAVRDVRGSHLLVGHRPGRLRLQ